MDSVRTPSVVGHPHPQGGDTFLWVPPSQQNKYTFPVQVFMEDTFSASEFVQTFRPQVDHLDSLKQELLQFHSFLREETISIIHREYNSFIEFSGQLESIKEQMDQTTMQDFFKLVDGVINQCSEQQKIAKQCRSKQERAVFLLNLDTQLQMLNDTLNKALESKQTESDDIVMCTEQLNYFKDHLNYFSQLPSLEEQDDHEQVLLGFFKQCEEKWKHIDLTLQSSLIDLLTKSTNVDQTKKYLQAICASNKQRDVELLLEDQWTKPIISHIQSTMTNISTKPEESLYNPLLTSLNDRFQHILSSISQLDFQHGFKIVTKCILPSVCKFLMEQKTLYEYRDRLRFHSQYLAQFKFLEQLEKLSPGELVDFRSDPYILELHKKWHLKVYFTLIKQDVAKNFEQECKNLEGLLVALENHENASKELTAPFLFKCEELLVQHVFHPQVFLPKLCYDFLNLFVQMLCRTQRTLFDYVNHVSGPQVKTIVCLLIQVDILRDRMKSLVDPIKPILSEKLLTLCDDLVNKSSDRLVSSDSLVQSAGDKTIPYFVSECSAGFEDIGKKLSITRRMSIPSLDTHAPYVSQILTPLISFYDEYAALLPRQILPWTRRIIEEVSESYLQSCKDHLTKAIKTENSIRRLQGSSVKKEGPNTSASILMQFNKDAAEFGRLIEQHFHIDPNDIEAYRQLIDLKINDLIS
ncbi:COG2 [Acrasis kona]|uniref:Conserved oligomeric Golgi complex subunit 2 n=1 Tax=Acrasis kona TaxID=1008807 RepID=A0AAW2Z7C1_9EUKA